MLSVQPNYYRLFRPWDASDVNELQTKVNGDHLDKEAKRKRRGENKRENRLRKIRGTFKKIDVNQDATVSTTTDDDKEKISSDPVASLSLCCDRLLQEPVKEIKAETTTLKPQEDTKNPQSEASLLPPVSNVYHPYMPDYLPTDIAHTLGVPPTDPLLLESLAQGYAMELEYARIIHQENEAKLLNARKQRPKKYKCPHCNVGFSNNGQLKGHIRIHTGERPYKCDEKNCGKTFTRNEELTRHKRIHSGVRPFPCPTCGKKFGRRDHLKKHTRTHFLQAERMMPVFVPLSAVSHGFPYLYGY